MGVEAGLCERVGGSFCVNMPALCSVQNDSLTKPFDTTKESLAGLMFTPRPLAPLVTTEWYHHLRIWKPALSQVNAWRMRQVP